MYYLLAFFLGLATFCNAQPPDLIIHNAVIYTLDEQRPTAQAIAMVKGKITRVGDNRSVLQSRGPNTKIINAQGKAVIPGLFDSHLHVIRAGRFYHAELRWDGVRTLKRALEMLEEQAKRTPPGQWVRVVGGWSAYQFEEKRLPTLEEINRATGNVPAFILHLYGHAYVNKAGLALLNIDARTPNPPGGLIEKDINGQPTGLLVAEPNAYLLYGTLARLPELNEEEQYHSTISFIRELHRLGITAVMDPGGGFQNYPGDYQLSNRLCTSGQLSLRLPYFLFAQKAGAEQQHYDNWIRTVEIGKGCDGHSQGPEYYVQGAGENILMSAADFENFDQPRPELSSQMEMQLEEVLKTLVQNRWPFRIHATYNQSISRFLDVIEKVNRQYPLNGLIWFFDHAETISEENLERVRALGGGISIQHRMAYQGESFIRRYGLEAAAQAPPVRKMIEMGLPVGMGSDGTRVSSYNPFVGLYWLTTGKTIGGTMHMSTANILDRITALKLFTTGSARLLKMEKGWGMLKEGFAADLAVLNEDYFKVPDEELLLLEAVLTIVNGKVVYADGVFKDLDPQLEVKIPGWSPVRFYGGYQKK